MARAAPTPGQKLRFIFFITLSSLILYIDITSNNFQSIKNELNTQENKEFIENEVLKPLIQQILDQMYPYFMWMGLFFMSMFLFIIIILMLNIKLFIHNQG